MNWIAPLKPLLRGRRPNLAQADRHRPGYHRDYYWKNVEKRRAYLSEKAREYRRRRFINPAAQRAAQSCGTPEKRKWRSHASPTPNTKRCSSPRN